MSTEGSAPGKFILSGEYAVVFGWPGIAIPAPLTLRATFNEDRTCGGIDVVWEDSERSAQWDAYLLDILHAVAQCKGMIFQGKLVIENKIPLRKGMGSSTALVVAVSRCFLGKECKKEALSIEQRMNPQGSGIDFAVIWEERPLLFRREREPQPIELPKNLLKDALLIDTGTPNETTGELVEWIRENQEDCADALATIGACTQMLLDGTDLPTVLKEHHRAQVTLGVVPYEVQELAAEIEAAGGAAKVLGAGARTGGGGMVLATGDNPGKIEDIATAHSLSWIRIPPNSPVL
ncbi:hypothetical protein COU80_02890 [Candidatus Peregrinibacteria bacterium CG10_big_fil_rev_8_21_14_0_10_55_24]|nr:MAG: hypothetical protein COU80_02890 [Candidatus Peregrinibacteria bacterium CG10_big_fil_rev_8_21_14_0_10_55_24]